MPGWPTLKRRFFDFLFVVALAAILLIALHELLINNIYKNVEDLTDGEMPTTVTSYPSGPEVASIIGGRGLGLNCSLLPGLDVFFDGSPDSKDNRHLVRQRFRQACVFHDLCYRHGLATYNYTQNDCDRILQNQAFRLCKYMRSEINTGSEAKTSDSERCQQDSKKLLAGVSLGGFDSYRAWDSSTFFEFDSNPVRSREFSASRVVDHPFKSVDPSKYQDEAQQVLLNFYNRRFNLSVECTTCKDKTILEWSNDPSKVSAELKSVGLDSRPEALIRRSLSLSEMRTIWLPPSRDHAAPHLLIDNAGKHRLIWMSRVSAVSTGSCIVLADAAKLLTYTLPKGGSCHVGAGSRLTMVQAEMYASSPLPLTLPGANPPDDFVATGLTPQRHRDGSLSLCVWSERIRATGDKTGGDEARCTPLPHEKIASGKGLGAFQNFAVVRPGQLVYLARDISLPPASNPLAEFLENAKSNAYSPAGSIIVVDVAAPTAPTDGSAVVKLKKVSQFSIDDRFDPMMPITRVIDDFRFLSLVTTDKGLGIYVTDFAEDNPSPREVGLGIGDTGLDLHPSWADRPALVVETEEFPRKVKLIFSRGHLIGNSDRRLDTVRLETLVLEREAFGPTDKPFAVTGGTACTVSYGFKPNPDRTCLRAFDAGRPMRASAAAMMKASQLLVGRFTASDGLGLAFADVCLNHHPLILAPVGDGRSYFTPTVRTVEQHNIKREVACTPLARERINLPIAD